MMLPDKRKGADEMKIQTVFERTEKKYIITLGQREKLLQIINQYIKPDEYGESTVCSLYFDTPDYRMIRQSMEKPVYKEKLRLRSYSTPKAGRNVFLELKKKYNGVVYKRRKTLEYTAAKNYIAGGEKPDDSRCITTGESLPKCSSPMTARHSTAKPTMSCGSPLTAMCASAPTILTSARATTANGFSTATSA